MSRRRSFREGWELPHDCGACRGKNGAERRSRWGCDQETEEAQLWVPCQFCDLAPEGKDCPTCKGLGHVPIRRCPLSILTADHAELFRLVSLYPTALPYAGGIYDQPAIYLEAVSVIRAAEAHLDREIEAAARAAQNRGGPPSGRV